MGQNVDLPDPSGLAQHTLSGSAGPRRARKTQRTATASSAARNIPSPRSQSPVRKSPVGGARADEDDDVGSIGGGSPSSPPIDRSDEGASSAEEGSPDQDGADASPAEEASPDDEASPGQEDDADEEMLAALSRCRSNQRRRSCSISGTGSASQPLVVRGSGAGPGGSPESPPPPTTLVMQNLIARSMTGKGVNCPLMKMTLRLGRIIPPRSMKTTKLRCPPRPYLIVSGSPDIACTDYFVPPTSLRGMLTT
ncbi:hypothetical protein PF010_g21313 [Phytophthora fragariae]|uniref:Uncharacterized protein n=1 Tax=Phytophthora fragariae TaxID=53985 RepID=A0A6G0KCE2_9STRA|nr:hypothetical protein PF010_g21313 [Phytophthora fragariae]